MLQNDREPAIIKGGEALSPQDIQTINKALAAKMRVEIVLTASGIKIYNVKRKELNT